MKRISSTKLALVMPILLLAFFTWVRIYNFIPIETHLEIRKNLLICLVISFLIFFPALMFLKIRSLFKIALFIVTTPVFIFFLLELDSTLNQQIEASIKTHRASFYYLAKGNNDIFYPHTNHYVFECDALGINCNSHYIGGSEYWGEAEFYIDEVTGEVYLFENRGDLWSALIFSTNEALNDNNYIDDVNLDNHDYYLIQYEKEGNHIYQIYQCISETNSACIMLPFFYQSKSNFEEPNLLSKESIGELSLVIRNQDIFTYGTQPKCYIEGCVITGK